MISFSIYIFIHFLFFAKKNFSVCRSSHYDSLLAAEAKAEKTKKGLFAEKEAGDKSSIVRIQELLGVSFFS